MSILRRTMQLSACVALAAFGAFSQQAPTNLYLLPNSSAVAPLFITMSIGSLYVVFRLAHSGGA